MPATSPDGQWEQITPPPDFEARGIPAVDSEPVPNCPVCGGSESAPHALGFDYELLTCSNPWWFVRCLACGHVWLNPRPSRASLAAIYPPHYYAYNYDEQVNSLALLAKDRMDRLKFRAILRVLGRVPQSYLDIGCGSGRYLKLMDRKGVPRSRNYGLELDAAVVDRLCADGYRVSCKRVEDCDEIPVNSIDLVTMFHVIEHVRDPGEVVGKVASWLGPGGLFAVETPNIESLDARLFRESYWGGYHIPRHWNLFTPTTLQRLLASRGLEVVATQYQTGHSFWMYSFHHWLRYGRKPCPWLARWFDPLRGLPLLAAFTAWDLARAALRFRTSGMLMLARRSRRPPEETGQTQRSGAMKVSASL
jgi:2-polyprenyl-3-methyl-5-hydroxy-6-metoxy-1,4-benzoquinol methylase